MNIEGLLRVSDSYDHREEKFLEERTLNEEEKKNLFEKVNIDNAPINILEGDVSVDDIEDSYVEASVSIGELLLMISFRVTLYLDKENGEVSADMDDLTGDLENYDDFETGGDISEIVMDALDNIEDDLIKNIEEKALERVKKDKKLKQYLN